MLEAGGAGSKGLRSLTSPGVCSRGRRGTVLLIGCAIKRAGFATCKSVSFSLYPSRGKARARVTHELRYCRRLDARPHVGVCLPRWHGFR